MHNGNRIDSSGTVLLALNSGSSSLKIGLFLAGKEDVQLLATGSADALGRKDGSLRLLSAEGDDLLHEEHLFESQEEALARLNDALLQHFKHRPSVIGHRFVHGGPHLRNHTWLTPDVRSQLQQAQQFAPLHIPLALRLVQQIDELYAGVPQVACFDTAFHRDLPPVAAQFPLPPSLFAEGILRYGFHGLSYESILARLGHTLPARTVVAHLGSGSSLAALRHGCSVDTTMGLSPTGGIPMSTRSGDLDPAILLFLLRNKGATADTLEEMLNKSSGLFAFSGGESDMQALLARSGTGEPEASLAVDAFCTAVAKTIGAYAAVLGGLELLVFTGGIGEHSAEIRRRVCGRLGFLGLPDGTHDAPNLRILPAEEEAQIARHCRALLQAR